jgi:hypothetical protein
MAGTGLVASAVDVHTDFDERADFSKIHNCSGDRLLPQRG